MRERASIPAVPACLLLYLALCLAIWPGRCFAAAPARAPEKNYRLAFTAHYPDKHPVINEVFDPWARDIAEQSKNRLFITCYGPDILIPGQMHYEALHRGTIAMAQQATGQTQGRMPASSFLYVPGGVASSAEGTAALWRMFKNTPEIRKEYENYKLLSLHASAPVQLHLAFQLKDPTGLRKKRILCQDAYLAAMLKAAGAVPLLLPASDFHEAIRQGKADGAALSFDMIIALGLDRLPFVQSVCVNICTPPYWTMMNKAVWDALPKDLQRVIDQKSGEPLGLKTAEALDTAAAAGRARMAGQGVSIKELNATESELWLAAFSPAARELWLAQMNAEKIKDPEKILARAYAR